MEDHSGDCSSFIPLTSDRTADEYPKHTFFIVMSELSI